VEKTTADQVNAASHPPQITFAQAGAAHVAADLVDRVPWSHRGGRLSGSGFSARLRGTSGWSDDLAGWRCQVAARISAGFGIKAVRLLYSRSVIALGSGPAAHPRLSGSLLAGRAPAQRDAIQRLGSG
jgi:hypothetical protein